jgi:thioredoxin reductase
MSTLPTYDVVVVGGGVAGLSAATWLGRYRRRTLLVDSGDYRNARVESSHGYLGRDGVSPAELLDDARRDLGRYDLVESRGGKVRAITGSKGEFVVDVDGEEVAAHRVVLATGVGDAFPDIEDSSTTTARAPSTARRATGSRPAAATRGRRDWSAAVGPVRAAPARLPSR